MSLLVVLLVGQRLRPNWPILLIGMLAATGAVAVFSLQQYGIVVIGPAATGMPALAVPHLSAADLRALALPALGIAVVAYSDNMLTARAFANRRPQTRGRQYGAGRSGHGKHGHRPAPLPFR